MLRKGFVLLETIVVITVLCVILLTLYSSYNKILIDVKKNSLYDNTEYIYKTELIRDYLEEQQEILEEIKNNKITIYCSNTIQNKTPCSNVKGKEMFEFLKVNSVYIMPWNVDIKNTEILTLEPTTQSYLKSLDAINIASAYRLVVMFESENDKQSNDYEYASLRFGSRG